MSGFSLSLHVYALSHIHHECEAGRILVYVLFSCRVFFGARLTVGSANGGVFQADLSFLHQLGIFGFKFVQQLLQFGKFAVGRFNLSLIVFSACCSLCLSVPTWPFFDLASY